jgi:hypothetical protein
MLEPLRRRGLQPSTTRTDQLRIDLRPPALDEDA